MDARDLSLKLQRKVTSGRLEELAEKGTEINYQEFTRLINNFLYEPNPKMQVREAFILAWLHSNCIFRYSDIHRHFW